MTSTLPPGAHVYQPSELNREARLHLEAGFPRVWLEGEISNLARPASGHLYFSLKDDRAQIRCALFKGNARGLGLRPENGQAVLAAGRLSLFEPRGDYQLIIDHLMEAGEGRLQEAFDAVRRKLEGEGLFDESRKKPLPGYPRNIAIVTSASGAALRDILHVLQRRWPVARVRVYPSLVQGEKAPAELVRALVAADRHGFGDVILLARGGGSLEDLWAFNDETLARTIAAMNTPVVSAVGHETDFTIADFVADVRAPTPTAAAELATPDGPELLLRSRKLGRRLTGAAGQALNRARQATDYLHRRLESRHPLREVDKNRQEIEKIQARLEHSVKRLAADRGRRLEGLQARLKARRPDRMVQRSSEEIAALRNRLDRAATRQRQNRVERLTATLRALEAVSPMAVLARGYAVIRSPEGQVLTRPQEFAAEQPVSIRLRDFTVPARITGTPRETDPSEA